MMRQWCCGMRTEAYHHLNVQAVVGADVEGGFCGSDARPCGGVVCLSHGVGLAVDALQGLVDDLEHADVPVVAVCVDDVCHPFQKLVGAVILIVNVEAGRGSILGRVSSWTHTAYLVQSADTTCPVSAFPAT